MCARSIRTSAHIGSPACLTGSCRASPGLLVRPDMLIKQDQRLPAVFQCEDLDDVRRLGREREQRTAHHRPIRDELDHGGMANVVAIVSILSTLAVAIAVPFINARLERRRLAWQSQQAQLDELRRLLDGATLRIQEATETLWAILDVPFPGGAPQTDARLATMDRSAFSDDQLTGLLALTERYERAFREVTQDQTRLDLRLGPADSITKAHHEVMRQLLAFQGKVVSAFSDFAAGAELVTVSWTLMQLEILAGRRDTLAAEVRAFFGSPRPT